MNLKLAILIASASASTGASATSATFSSGLQAQVHREIAIGPNAKSFTYSVLGATKLTVQGQSERSLSVECIGIDTEANGGTNGQGFCVWKDASNDVLYLVLKTSGSGNHYTITGGSGKWKGANGSFETTFAYLPGPDNVLLLTESGRGQINR